MLIDPLGENDPVKCQIPCLKKVRTSCSSGVHLRSAQIFRGRHFQKLVIRLLGANPAAYDIFYLLLKILWVVSIFGKPTKSEPLFVPKDVLCHISIWHKTLIDGHSKSTEHQGA